MSRRLSVKLSREKWGVVMSAMRQGLVHLHGEAQVMQLFERLKPMKGVKKNDVRISDMFTRHATDAETVFIELTNAMARKVKKKKHNR
jgi:limonene-1,2-epoxide hydrolase